MRLDLFLKASRLCARRTVAQSLCNANLVLVNGRTAKSAHVVNAGDEITIRRHNRETRVKVMRVPATRQTSRAESGKLYELVEEITLNSE